MSTYRTPDGKIIDDKKDIDAVEASWGKVLNRLAKDSVVIDPKLEPCPVCGKMDMVYAHPFYTVWQCKRCHPERIPDTFVKFEKETPRQPTHHHAAPEAME